MSRETVHIYIHPDADVSTYPEELTGDMSVFRSVRSIKYEVQWVFYLMLKDQGMNVQICTDYPREGIFVIHKANSRQFVWRPNLFIVSLQWDYKRDDRAQMHMVSNHHKATREALGLLDRMSFAGLQHYNPPVMHSVLTPRDDRRGDRFETIAFIGDPKNMDDAFKTREFHQALESMGMHFVVIDDPQKLADFSDVDAVVAVREFGKVVNNKPPVKLINSWRGGVPALLGCEIGYREARESEYDYIEVDSMEETLTALKRLKEDLEYRNKFIANARERGAPYSAEGQQQAWIKFFHDVVLPANEAWQRKSSLNKTLFLCVRWIRWVIRISMSYIWRYVLGRKSRDYRT